MRLKMAVKIYPKLTKGFGFDDKTKIVNCSIGCHRYNVCNIVQDASGNECTIRDVKLNGQCISWFDVVNKDLDMLVTEPKKWAILHMQDYGTSKKFLKKLVHGEIKNISIVQ